MTAGAATTALYYTVNKVIRNNRSYIGREFWHAFKTNFRQSTIVWLILLLLYAIMGFDCYVMYQYAKAGVALGKIYIVFAVLMMFAYLAGVFINVGQEMGGNPRISEMGIAQDHGAMEGKEVRLGAGATALWSVTTTVTSNGSVNGMHDSTMPLSGMVEMLNMQINTWFGGVGVGWLNYYTFIIMAVFISGLMVGRTPEFLGWH